MKKVIYICFTVLFLMVAALNFLNMSFNSMMSVTQEKANVLVEKPENITNKECLNDIINTCIDLNGDVMIERFDAKKKIRKLYKTNVNDDFIDIKTGNGSQLLNNGECLSTQSTVDGYQVIPLFMSTLTQNTTIYSIESSADFDLSGTYYVDENIVNDFADKLTAKGYTVNMPQQFDLSGDVYDVLAYAFAPLLIVIVGIFIYFVSKGKEHTLKRLEGYSAVQIIIKETVPMIKNFLLIFLLIQVINIGIFAFTTKGLTAEYIHYIMQAQAPIYLFIIILGVIACSLTVLMHKKQSYINGKTNRNIVFVITSVLKLVCVIVLCFNFIYLSLVIPESFSKYLNVKMADETFRDYVTVNVYGGDSTEEAIEKTNKKLVNFYKATVDDFHGIYVDSTQYNENYMQGYDFIARYFDNYKETPNVYNNVTPLEICYISQNSIYVNKNYFNVNPIYKVNGTEVSEDDLSKDKINILIPDNAWYEEGFEIYQTEYLNPHTPINVIHYKAGEKVRLYQQTPQSGYSSGYGNDPIIYVIDGALLSDKNFFANIASNYMLKTETNDPYTELLPAITDCQLQGNILDVSMANDSFAESLNTSLQTLIIFVTTSCFYLILYLLILIFCCKSYIETYRDEIAVNKLAGQSFFKLYKLYLILAAVIFVISAVVSFTFKEQFYTLTPVFFIVPTIIWLIEMVVFKIYSSRSVKNNIINVLKGK